MAFIAIDAKADVSNSKKGKLTPAQHAQLNAWCLASKTGILDWGGRCGSTASAYSVAGSKATVIFNRGFLVICGRFVECEQGTQVEITAPLQGTVSGKIIAKFDLNNSGAEEFSVLTKDGELVQQDLNQYPLTGVYEFELYSYTATPTTVTLTRTNTDYIPDIGGKLQQFITVLTGTGMTGTGNPPLQGYDKSKGTIESRLDGLGFKQASITVNQSSYLDASNTDIRSLGKVLYGNINLVVPSGATSNTTISVGSISNVLLPTSNITLVDYTDEDETTHGTVTGRVVFVLKTNGDIECTLTGLARLVVGEYPVFVCNDLYQGTKWVCNNWTKYNN